MSSPMNRFQSNQHWNGKERQFLTLSNSSSTQTYLNTYYNIISIYAQMLVLMTETQYSHRDK